MVLAAGTFFWLARALLGLSAHAALLWPVKKIAAVIAMVGATAYCVFSGSEVATERSLITTLVLFGAILADRPALSIRNLAIAALLVLAREPESLVGPSFQMSFGAVAGLIALAPLLQPSKREGGAVPAVWRLAHWVLRSAVGLVAMTLVASLATAPFAAFHFQTLNPFGLIGNGLALPLVSLALMPAALLGVLAYPFGLDRPIWQLMGFAVEKVLEVSAWVSGFAGSTVVVPAPSPGAVALLALALILATVPVSALRWLALAPAAFGLAAAASPARFDLVVDRDGSGAAIRGQDGRLVLVGKPSDFVVEQWLRADGDSRASDDPSLRSGARCDDLGCVVRRRDGSAVAYIREASAFAEDCRRAAAVITRLPAPKDCRAALVIDRATLQANGAVTATWRDGGPKLQSTRSAGDARPWERRTTTPPQPSAPADAERPRRARPFDDLPDDTSGADEDERAG
jgi:competence protein ComEC